MTYHHTCAGTCSRGIDIDYDPATLTLTRVQFIGGCHGNTQGVQALCAGRPMAQVAQTLRGINCRDKGTSCPDQLARAIEAIMSNI